jgi:hypothetical protein
MIVTKYGNQNIRRLNAQNISNKTNPKSKLGFQKWTKKMSKIEKSNKVLKKTL